MKKLICILLLFFSLKISAQSNYYLIDTTGIQFESLSDNDKHLLDSILPIANEAKHDSTLIKYLDFLVENCWDENIWPKYNRLIIDIADKNLSQKVDSFYLSYKANAINNVGYYYNSHGKSVLALENYSASLNLFKQIKELHGQPSPLNNLGYTYKYLGDIDKALYYYHQALKIREQLGDEKNTSVVINNLASLYEEQGNDSIAKVYYKKTLKIGLKFQKKRSIALAYSNLGLLFSKNNQNDSALIFFQKAYDIREEIGFKRGMAQSLINIGSLLESKNDSKIVLEYYTRALLLVEEQGLLKETTNVKYRLSSYHFKLGDTKKALKYSKSAYSDALTLGYPDEIKRIALLLSEVYKTTGDYKKSMEMFELSTQMRDSLINLKNQKLAYRTQINYEFEQKETKRAIEEEKKQIFLEKEQERKNIILFSVTLGMILSLSFLLFLYNRFLIIKKQKLLIEKQKSLVDNQRNELLSKNELLNLKNNMITDSIYYAKKIQNAILATQEHFKQHFRDAFVFYRPKDIVSGDFYWVHQVDNTILFTAADCTGHGVPGAFMSLIGNNILDNVVRELNITQPDLILEKMSDELQRRLKSDNESTIKDGMDLVICAIDINTLKLQISGAYNPMYIIRDGELTQFKSDRYQLGNLEQINNRKFSLHEFQLQKDDLIYLFSDGFADQKGGEKGKKFYYPQFRQLLIKISKLSMKEQQEELSSSLDEWKGKSEQIDDILILGIRI